MGVCAFVSSGVSFDVDRYLKGSPFKAIRVFRKGEIPAKENPDRLPRPDSGFVVLVSDNDETDFSDQVVQALKFLKKQETAIVQLRSLGVDNMLLDFSVQPGDQIQQSESLIARKHGFKAETPPPGMLIL